MAQETNEGVIPFGECLVRFVLEPRGQPLPFEQCRVLFILGLGLKLGIDFCLGLGPAMRSRVRSISMARSSPLTHGERLLYLCGIWVVARPVQPESLGVQVSAG